MITMRLRVLDVVMNSIHRFAERRATESNKFSLIRATCRWKIVTSQAMKVRLFFFLILISLPKRFCIANILSLSSWMNFSHFFVLLLLSLSFSHLFQFIIVPNLKIAQMPTLGWTWTSDFIPLFSQHPNNNQPLRDAFAIFLIRHFQELM